MSTTPQAASSPNPDPWEAAYLRFETPEQEIQKFLSRLRKLGAESWPRESQVLDLFCGRGNGMNALHRLGFTNLEGIDLSPKLIEQHKGAGKVILGDCRHLPFKDNSRDIAIVQGGLHHLPKLPDDLEQTLAEVRRVLRPDGRFMVVEPWLTPFLRFVHWVAKKPVLRRVWPKLDACQTMIENEIDTYENWLSQPQMIRDLLDKHFTQELRTESWGKIMYLGRKSTATDVRFERNFHCGNSFERI